MKLITLELKMKLFSIPFFIANSFSLLMLNLFLHFTNHQTFFFESLFIIFSIFLTKKLIELNDDGVYFVIPALVLITYSFVNLMYPNYVNLFLNDSWLMFQIISLVYLIIFGDLITILFFGVLIFLSPLIAIFYEQDFLIVVQKQTIIYFLYPILIFSLLVYNNQLRTVLVNRKKDENESLNGVNESEFGENLVKMSSLIIHEVSNPLSVSVMLLHKMKNESHDLNEINKIMKIEKHLSRVIDIVKMYKKRASVGIEKIKLNLSQMIEDEVELYTMLFEKYDVKIMTQIDKEIFVIANEREISQVIGNLLTNAFQALQSSSKSQEKFIRLELQQKNGTATLIVSDNADGIDFDIQDKIFNENFSTKKDGSNQGLGLYLVKKILSCNNANIRFVSDSNGTRFIISFHLD